MKNTWIEALGTLFVAVVITATIFVSMLGAGKQGRESGIRDMRHEAVAAGHAEYVAGEDGSPIWRWKALPGESK